MSGYEKKALIFGNNLGQEPLVGLMNFSLTSRCNATQ